MPDLSIRKETPTRFDLVHHHLAGWVFAGLGSGVVWVGVTRVDDGTGSWLVPLVGSMFALVGTLGAFWRFDLTLDLMTRRYEGRRGLWPNPRRLQGSLDELRGIVLTTTGSGNKGRTRWRLALEFEGWDKTASFYEAGTEIRAYAELERLARKLRAAAIDRTGDGERRRTWTDLDRGIAPEQADAGWRSTPGTEPPPGSRIVWEPWEGTAAVVLPCLGFSAGTLVLAAFGAVFAAAGAFALLAVSHLVDARFDGSNPAGWIVGGVFVLFGTGLASLAIVGSYARTSIREDGEAIAVDLHAFGRRIRGDRVLKREVEEISLRPTVTTRGRGAEVERELVIRSDERIVRVGRELSRGEKEWLLETVTRMARR